MKQISELPARREVESVSAPCDRGLTTQQALLREQNGWSNASVQSATRTEKEIVLQNCVTFFNLVFVILALLLLLAGSSPKNMTFLIVVVCNAVIGCFQEIRAKRAVDKLTLVAAQQVRTIRDGQKKMIRSDLLVRDDIVEFVAGDQICADALVRAGRLQVNESLITGEADAITKAEGDVLRSGSFVISGKARAQLTAVGADSYAAKLAVEAKADPRAEKSEMMRSLDRLIRVVGVLLIPIGLLLFYQEYQVLEKIQ